MLTNIEIAQRRIDYVIKNSDRIKELELSSLDLTDHDFSKIKRINELVFLERLHLSHNLLTKIPDNIFEFENLTLLDLSHNDLGNIDNRIGQLKNLKILWVLRNNIREFPEAILELTEIQELSLAENRVKFIPETITKKDKDNKTDIIVAKGIGCLSKLQVFFINNNEIKHLPNDFIKMNSLIALFVFNNPISVAVNGVADFVGRETIMNYYKFHHAVSHIKKLLIHYKTIEDEKEKRRVRDELKFNFTELEKKQERKFDEYKLDPEEMEYIPFFAFEFDYDIIFEFKSIDKNYLGVIRHRTSKKLGIQTKDLNSTCLEKLTTR